MKEIVQIKTRELYNLLMVKDVDILLAYRLFDRIFRVAWNMNQLHTAEESGDISNARWSLAFSQKELNTILDSMNLCELDRDLVRYIAEHYEIE